MMQHNQKQIQRSRQDNMPVPADLLAGYEQTIVNAKAKFEAIAKAHGQVVFSQEAEFARQIFSREARKPAAKAFLFKCSQESVYNAISQVASIGLSLNPKLQHAHLIPRFITDSGWECTLDLGYRGIVKLGVDAGVITHVNSDNIYLHDIEEGNFRYNGPTQEPSFTGINPFDKRRFGKQSEGVVTIAHLKDGGIITSYISRSELDNIASKGGPVWNAYRDEMEKKTGLKRNSKVWPMPSDNDRLQVAMEQIYKEDKQDYGDVNISPNQQKTVAQDVPQKRKLHSITQQLIAMKSKG